MPNRAINSIYVRELVVAEARELGYNLEGDWLLVPWTEDAAPREAVILQLAQVLGGRASGSYPRGHGRIGYTIHLATGDRLDLSVLPRYVNK